MDLGSDKLTISKLDNIELREIMRSTISNLNSRNQNLRLGQTLRKNKFEQEQEVNENERHKDKISSQSSATHKECLHLRCGAHKEPGLFQPQSTPNDHQDLVRLSLSNPHEVEGNTNFPGSTTTLVTPVQPCPSRRINIQE
jgi:hypothetical protein